MARSLIYKLGMTFAFRLWLLFYAVTIFAQDSVIPISNLNQTNAGSFVAQSSQSFAISFSTSNTLTALSTVSVSMAGVHPTSGLGRFTLAFYSDSGGLPGSNLIILSGNNYPTNAGIYDYTNTSALLLATNTIYWIVGSSSNSTGGGHYLWNVTGGTTLDSASIWALGAVAYHHGSVWQPYSNGDYLQFGVAVRTNLPVPPLISIAPTASAIIYGQTLASSILSGGQVTNAAGVTVGGSFAFTTPSTTLPTGTFGGSVIFSPADYIDYTTVTTSVPVTVLPQTPLISRSPAAFPITSGQTLASSGLFGGAATNASGMAVGGSFTFTSTSTVPGVGISIESVTFTPTDTTNYTSAIIGVPVPVGRLWTQATNGPSEAWISVAASADGTKLVAAGIPLGIYTSTNSGISWTEATNTSSQEWESVAASADGTKLVAAAAFGGIYTSTNSGLTWTLCPTSPYVEWNCIASSSDGSKLVATAAFDGNGNSVPIYISADCGKTWTATAPSNNWVAACSSADGTKLAAAVFDGPIYSSTNSGTTWNANTNTIAYWRSIASSADGAKLIAGTSPGSYVYTSTNSGAVWQSHSPSLLNDNFGVVASSADGVRLAAADQGVGGGATPIFISPDSGQNWIVQNSTPTVGWGGIASSADGQFLVGVINGHGACTSQTMPAPQMNLMQTNGSLQLSWLVPSTNFVVQQSSDLLNWESVTNTPELDCNNLQDEMILLPCNASGFFRLASP